MKPSKFTYHAPRSAADAVTLLEQLGDDAKVLAGGQSLVPILALRLAVFGHLVDLNRARELAGVSRTDGKVRIGSMTRQRDAGEHPDVITGLPLVAKAIPLIGHFQIRNRGTVGGSLAHADPASELPAVALALDAELEVLGPRGPRRIGAREFFVSTWTTAMRPDEILTAVEFPTWRARSGFAVEEVARRSGDFAIVGAACGVRLDESGAVAGAAVALFGVAPTPVRARDAEDLLVGRAPDHPLDDIGEAAAQGLAPSDDVHASGDYRRRVAAVVVRRSVAKAIEEAGRG